MNINNFLSEIKSIEWFKNSGIPNENYYMVSSVFEAYDSWNNEMLKTWEAQITELENEAMSQIGDSKTDEIFTLVSENIGEIIYKCWEDFILKQHLEDESGLDDEMMDMVKRDMA